MANPDLRSDPNGMGFGILGGNDVVFKRKYRWLFSVYTDCPTGGQDGLISPQLVKLASRPNLTVEETEINFLHGKMWIPGKGSWETVTVTYYDLGGSSISGDMTNLYSWLATVYNFTTGNGSITLSQSSIRGTPSNGGLPSGQGGYAATGVLDLYDGCGKSMETWTLGHMWPQAVNFGELDYSSSEEVTIELTLRYSEVGWVNHCPEGTVMPCCTGCN